MSWHFLASSLMILSVLFMRLSRGGSKVLSLRI
nr:MAG TPA: hypothetical protein [Caudoviricetes sp.]DAP15478.1 MAG TPA: hypothetical protein [Caudoviricetes sp.]